MELIVLILFLAAAVWIGIRMFDIFVSAVGITLVIIGFLTVSAFLLVQQFAVFFMFKPGQLVTWQIKGTWLEQNKSFWSNLYGYILHEDKDDPGVWHVMMMRKGSDTLHREEIYGDYLKVVETKT